MRRNQLFYRAIEAVIGRQLAWRIGRFLYLGARRELVNDPATNGEYALIGWVLDAIVVARKGAMPENRTARTLVFVDAGANLGEWTRKTLDELEKRGLGSAARIEAFEPAPEQHAHLRDELAAEVARGRVGVHPPALAAQSGLAKFIVTGARTGTSALAVAGVASRGKQIEVEISTLDEMAARLSIEEILLIKIDTEGNDFNVIRGAEHLLDAGRVSVVQFEYNSRWVGFGHRLQSVFQFIESRVYALGLLTQDGIEVHDEWHPELERYMEANYVLVRRDILELLPCQRVVFTKSNTVKPA